jgi:malonyl-CoA/methylmalonyl-CoA synthetase
LRIDGPIHLVTFLSILGTHSIALPLSPAFPPHELQYIMDHSQASILLSSKKFEARAQELLNVGLETPPKHISIEKHVRGTAHRDVLLEGPTQGAGGMMLYTSGTTNRPVGVSGGSRFQLLIWML